MGLILDTGLLIRAEREGLSVSEALERWLKRFREEEFGISVVSLAEFAHGIARATDEQRRSARTLVLDGLRRSIPVYSIEPEIAIRAGLIEGGCEPRVS